MKTIVLSMKPMLGSQGILPALFTRVNRTAYPQERHVMALLRAGGYMRMADYEVDAAKDAELEGILAVVMGREPGTTLLVDAGTGGMRMRPWAGSRIFEVGNVLSLHGLACLVGTSDGETRTFRVEATDISGASALKEALGFDHETYVRMRSGPIALTLDRRRGIEASVALVERMATIHSEYSKAVDTYDDQEAGLPKTLRGIVAGIEAIETVDA